MNTFIDSYLPDAPERIAEAIIKSSQFITKDYREVLFLCIGSDRMTGDCLGPLTGQLLKSHLSEKSPVYGTLSSTVHACNLKETISEIFLLHPDALILAVDASLGSKKHLGYATIANGALFPGAGVQKKLPPVGDLHITGIVNTSDFQDYFALQTTRLSMVLALSDVIAQGIMLSVPTLLAKCSHK